MLYSKKIFKPELSIGHSYVYPGNQNAMRGHKNYCRSKWLHWI